MNSNWVSFDDTYIYACSVFRKIMNFHKKKQKFKPFKRKSYLLWIFPPELSFTAWINFDNSIRHFLYHFMWE